MTNGFVVHWGKSGNPDANVGQGVRMSLTALLFSAVGETGPYRQAGIHKVQVAEFYQCWCFSATGGGG